MKSMGMIPMWILPIEMIGMWIVPMWIPCQKLVRVCHRLVRVCHKPKNKPLKTKGYFKCPSLILLYTVINSYRRGSAHLCERWHCPPFPLGKRELFSSRGVFQEGGTR